MTDLLVNVAKRPFFLRGAFAAVLIGIVVGNFALRGTRAADAFSPDLSKVTTQWKVPAPAGDKQAVFAGGCFWAMQAEFSELKGVDRVVAGYAGGTTADPTYDKVTTETTGYAETVRIDYNPATISYKQLLNVFFRVHDPTTLDRQGDDVGTSYRSIAFYENPAQETATKDVIAQVNASHVYNSRVVTEVLPFTKFYQAEDYHQNFAVHNPDEGYVAYTVVPEVARFRARFKPLLK